MSQDKTSSRVTVRTFERNHPLLFSIDYRMLGCVTDTEDVVQEPYPSRAVRDPTRRADKIARFFFEDGSPRSITNFGAAERSIRVIRLVVDPEKLRNIPYIS
jgi:hypothetical protein